MHWLRADQRNGPLLVQNLPLSWFVALTDALRHQRIERQYRSMKRRPLDRWRSICPCNRHRGSGMRGFLRFPAALLLGVPIAFGAVKLPDAKAVVVRQESAPSRAPRDFITFPPLDDDLNIRGEADFRLITPKIRSQFLAEKIQTDSFTMELVHADYFHQEIPYGGIIYREARRHGLQPELIAAVIEAESGFRPRLQSPKNAMGLMQIVPATGAMMGGTPEALFNPAENVRLGVKYLKYLDGRFGGDQRLVLAAYNAGEATVRRYGGVPPYAETQDYLLRVARCKQKHQRQLAGRVVALSSMVGE